MPSEFGLSIWTAGFDIYDGLIELVLLVEGPPIRLSHYAIKSADSDQFKERDPKKWQLVAFDENNNEHIIHDMNDDS